MQKSISRRALVAAGMVLSPALALSGRAFAQELKGDELPLVTTGLEHIGMVVPNVDATARFYSSLFNPNLQKEKDPPLRYYVMLGAGYIAIGGRPGVADSKIDHFCTLVRGYQRDLMTEALAVKGLASASRGVVPDPDGIGLQLIATPGGPGPTAVPGERLIDVDPLVDPLGMDSIVLNVADLKRSADFYAHFFNEGTAPGEHQIAFKAADTLIVLRRVRPGESPGVDHYSVRVRRFDQAKVAVRLAALGARLEGRRRTGLLHFYDPNGLGVVLKTV